MGRLEDLRINAYLSEVARGYKNSAFIADALFPTIESDLEKVDIFEFNKEAFQVYNTERAIRADSNVISPKGFNKKTVTLTEHDLAYPLDYREEEESKKVKLQLHATNVVTEGLKLKQEKQKLELEVNGSKLAIISLEKRQADLSSYLKKQKIELSSLAKTTTNQNIADLKKKINNLDEKINQTAKLVDQLLEKQSQITNRTDQTKDDLFNLERQASQKNNQIENLTAKIKLWQKTLDDLRQDNDKLIANLWLELNLEPKHLNLASKTSNSENLGLTIQKLKNRLQTLGGFDPEIIKECKTCQVRTEFLTQEKIISGCKGTMKQVYLLTLQTVIVMWTLTRGHSL